MPRQATFTSHKTPIAVCWSMDPLVRQKNDLLALIHCGELALATTVLDFLAPSWAASNYGYKATELRALIGQALVRREYRGASE